MKREKEKTLQEIFVFENNGKKVLLKGDLIGETVWATQAQIAEVFGIDRTVVTKHIRNILRDGEVDEKSNVQKMHIANSDKPVSFYSLDISLAVGYRTNFFEGYKISSVGHWHTQTACN